MPDDLEDFKNAKGQLADNFHTHSETRFSDESRCASLASFSSPSKYIFRHRSGQNTRAGQTFQEKRNGLSKLVGDSKTYLYVTYGTITLSG